MTMSITKRYTRFIPCSLLSDCKNVQKSALKSVNVQRTGKSILQMFAFSFFEGSHICRFLPILRPSTVPRSHFSYPKTKVLVLIIRYLYLQIVTSISESNFYSIVFPKCAISKTPIFRYCTLCLFAVPLHPENNGI